MTIEVNSRFLYLTDTAASTAAINETVNAVKQDIDAVRQDLHAAVRHDQRRN